MTYKNANDGLAHALWDNAERQTQVFKFLNKSRLTTIVMDGRNTSTLYLNTARRPEERVRWTADNWLKCLLATRLARLVQDKLGNWKLEIILDVPKGIEKAMLHYAQAEVFTRSTPRRGWTPESRKLTGVRSSEILEGKQIGEKSARGSGA